MNDVELYDKRFDWLVASLAAIPLIWLFYGFDAAFVSLLLFALIGAMKPLVNRLGSRLGRATASAQADSGDGAQFSESRRPRCWAR